MSAQIDLIVPTIKGREDSLERCLESYRRNSIVELNEIVVMDSETCGWGWRRGLRLSEAPYVLFACDDQECIGSRWAQVCIEAADRGLIACPRVWHHKGVIESQGGDMNSFRHVVPRPQRDWTPVDYSTIPFCSREMADAIGMIPVDYSSDVWVSYRGRQLGWESALRHGFDIRHWMHEVGRAAGAESVEARDAADEKVLRAELAKHLAEVEA